jgi:hypothetical protein
MLLLLSAQSAGTTVLHVSALYFCENGCGAYGSGLPLLHIRQLLARLNGHGLDELAYIKKGYEDFAFWWLTE